MEPKTSSGLPDNGLCILGWRSREEQHSFMVCGCTRSQGHRTAPLCCNSGSWLPLPGPQFLYLPITGERVARQTKQDGGGAEHLVLAGGCQSPGTLIDWRQHRLISSCLSWVLSAIQSPLHRSLSLFLPITPAVLKPLQAPSQASAVKGQHFPVSETSCLLSISSWASGPFIFSNFSSPSPT